MAKKILSPTTVSRFPANDNAPVVKAHNGPWDHLQNPVIVGAYMALAADKQGGPLPRGEQAERCRATMGLINKMGPYRGDRWDAKFQDISAILAERGRQDLMCHGFKPRPVKEGEASHVQRDKKRNVEKDSMLWKSIDSAVALHDAMLSIGAVS